MGNIVRDENGGTFTLEARGGGSWHAPFGGQSLRSALGRAASVRSVFDYPENRHAMAEALVEASVLTRTEGQSMSFEEIRQHAHGAFGAGRLSLVPYRPSLRPICIIEDVEPPESLTEGLVEEEVKPTHTLEIELVDEDEEPVPGEPYRVELPSGDIMEGRLNNLGRAMLTGIVDSGNCKVTFPRLDEAVWGPG
ncbi:MAG: hypothetical protein AAF799_36720 [Myxococcota bacterium]